MPAHRLKLFRRHAKNCSKGYPKDLRIVEGDSLKATKRAQCRCTIVAQGTLPSGKFLKHPSTGENVWAEAHKVAELWSGWGDIVPPAEVVRELQEEENKKATPVSEAVEEFIAAKRGENVSRDVIAHHHQLFRERLVPFAKSKGYLYVQQLDNAECWAKFRQSWVNLNPTHNKKVEDGMKAEVVPVAPRTAKRMLSQTREFIRFCISRNWLTKEWAARNYLKVITSPEPKEPFSEEDVNAICECTTLVTDGRQAGQQNARELLLFCYVLRYSGLRISDVVKLEAANLVKRPGDPDNYSLHVFQKKTRKWVYIPIPSGENDLPGHPDVAGALKSLPLKQGKYLFLGGKGTLRCNVSSWRNRLTRLFRLTEETLAKRGRSLSVHPHPHRFRHTFAAWLLEHGMDVRDVAEFLGDTVAVVVKHYAKYTTRQQKAAVWKWKEAMSADLDKRKKKFQVIDGRK